jgi:hypothetical protein
MSPTVRYHTEALRELFHGQRIATMEQLKQHLGTDVDITVFRKLKELSYATSYSHNGRYYTLAEITRFDELGLWSYRSVRFSQHGTLLRTAQMLVETSHAGYFGSELKEILHVEVKHALRKLVEQGHLAREQVQNRWLYCSPDPQRRQQQRHTRHMTEGIELPPRSLSDEVLADEIKAAIIIFFSLLDEKLRRLYAGLEAMKWGHGGNRRIANLLGLDEKTVALGRRELLEQAITADRVRRPGGGRHSVKKGHQQ